MIEDDSINELNKKIENLNISESNIKKEEKIKIGFCFDERMLLHKDVNHKHQECPERLMTIYINLVLKNIIPKLIRIPSIEAIDEDILRVHSKEYLDQIKALQIENKNITNHTLKEKDSYDNYATYESAKIAAGSLINCVKQIINKTVKHCFAIIRPPGHHADKNNCKGFCIFNSVAISIEYIKQNYKDKKIAIIDWDVHHGDGTQKIFYSDKNPLFISIHRHDNGKFYPFVTGFSNEHGENEGLGYNLNIPLDTKISATNGASCIGDSEYLYIFDKLIIPVIKDYNPDLIFISCGFDAGENDFSGCLKCTPITYAFMTKKLMELNKNLIFTLEGGYTLDTLKRCSECVIRTLLNEENSFDKLMIENYLELNGCDNLNLSKIVNEYEEIFRPVGYVMEKINSVIKENENYWNCIKDVKMPIHKEKIIREDNFDKNNEMNKKIFEKYLINKNEEEFLKENEEFIIFKIGKELINSNDKNINYNKILKKKIKSFRTILYNINFNIESVKFTKLRANATKINKILNWNRDELKYDMNSSIISEILTLFFQHLNVKNKQILSFLENFLNLIQSDFENNLDIYNCDLILIPIIIPIENKDNNKKDEKKKFKIVRKKEKVEFKIFLNGIKQKNIYYFDENNRKENKHNFLNGIKSLIKFIKENVMN